MDYESRKVKWYWFTLFLIFCGVAIYLLFKANPYLYSHLELRSAIDSGESLHRQSIPANPVTADRAGNPTFYTRYGLDHAAVDPNASPRSKNYEEWKHYPVNSGIEKWDVQNVAQDQSGFYLTGKNPWAVHVDLEGQVRWKFKFKDETLERGLFPVLLDDSSAYIIHPEGEVVVLNKATGEIRWTLDLREDLQAAPFLWKENLILPVRAVAVAGSSSSAPTGLQLISLNRLNGKVGGERKPLALKPGFQLSYTPEAAMFVATVDNKIVGIQPDTWQILWTQTMTDPVRGPAIMVTHQVFAATLGGKIVRLDASKKGKVDWEVDLERPAATAPAYLPVMMRLSFLDTAGAMVAVDAKVGKVLWRGGIENKNPLNETWSARVKGQNIEEFKMDWLHKGWTIWSPCGDRHFCIYTPNKGQPINRIALSASPMALPLPVDRRLLFFGQTKGGGYMVSVALEETEVKKLNKSKETAAE